MFVLRFLSGDATDLGRPRRPIKINWWFVRAVVFRRRPGDFLGVTSLVFQCKDSMAHNAIWLTHTFCIMPQTLLPSVHSPTIFHWFFILSGASMVGTLSSQMGEFNRVSKISVATQLHIDWFCQFPPRPQQMRSIWLLPTSHVCFAPLFLSQYRKRSSGRDWSKNPRIWWVDLMRDCTCTSQILAMLLPFLPTLY